MTKVGKRKLDFFDLARSELRDPLQHNTTMRPALMETYAAATPGSELVVGVEGGGKKLEGGRGSKAGPVPALPSA